MMIWSADNLSNALGITCLQHLQANQIQFNSNDVQIDDLFVALKGSRDGHEFVFDAASNGASVLVINHNQFTKIELEARSKLGGKESSTYKIFINKLLEVEDTGIALHKLAKYKRDHSKAKFIAITGSAGKTSTKEALNNILSKFGKSFASRGNFNNKLGLAINLASMPDDIDYAVLELGMNAAGEISELTKQVRPDIAAITSIFGVHIEYFGNIQGIAKAKCEIFEALDPEKGVAIIPGDYQDYNTCKTNLEKRNIKNIRSFNNYSRDVYADSRMLSYSIFGKEIQLEFDVCGYKTTVTMPYIPKHIAGNFTLCLLMAKELGLDLNIATKALGSVKLTVGRGEIITCTNNLKKLTLITDYYNSNPESLRRAIDNLVNIPSDIEVNSCMRKVAIIGDMGELGESSIAEHQSILEHIKNAEIDLLILVGNLAMHIADQHNTDRDSLNIAKYPSMDKLLVELDDLIKHNDLILIKASRFMKFEQIAKYLGIKNAL